MRKIKDTATMRNVKPDVSGEEQLSEEEQKHAISLIMGFCALYRACRLYDLKNELVTKILKDMHSQVQGLSKMEEGHVFVTVAGHSFFINRRLVRLGFGEYHKAKQLKGIWGKLGVGEVVFSPGMTFEGIADFANQYIQALKDPSKVEEFVGHTWGGALARPMLGDDQPGNKAGTEESCELAVRVFCGLLVQVQGAIKSYKDKEPTPMARIKRSLQVLVEKMEQYDGLLLALTRSVVFREELISHMVNTAVLSLIVGRGLQLTRRDLISLATTALFHDLPKIGLNDDTLNALEQPDSLGPKEKDQVGAHWLTSVRKLVQDGGLQTETLPRLVVAYESQMEFSRQDLYTKSIDEQSKQTLFSKIVVLCDRLDTLTWPRPGKKALSPHEAVLKVMEESGSRFDPTLVRILLGAYGLFPTGTVVRLSTGEVAVVLMQDEGGDLEQPVVQIVADAQGATIEDGEKLRLKKDPRRDVVGSERASKLGINAVACFRAEPGEMEL